MTDLILPLVDEKDPFLREVPEIFDFDNPQVDSEKLEDQLIENMIHYRGIGLSATQIGIPITAFAMISDGQPFVVINPKILEWSDEDIYEKEGCLSFPYLFMPVLRSETVGTRFQLKDGSEQMGSFRGLLSIIFQHEMGHMEGELFIDNVSDFKLRSAMKKRRILKRKSQRRQNG